MKTDGGLPGRNDQLSPPIRAKRKMAAPRYFKKLTPQTNVVVSPQYHLQFKTLDHLVGYYATDVDWVQQALEGIIREGRFGVTEISAEEFKRDYLEKKTQAPPLEPVWREEMAVGQIRDKSLFGQIGPERVSAVAGVEQTKPTTSSQGPMPSKETEIGQLKAPLPPPPPKEFKPTIGKRKPRPLPRKAE